MNKRTINKFMKAIEKMGFNVFFGDYGVSVTYEPNEQENVPFDYYGETTNGYPWINQQLENLIDGDYYWEWVNPAVIVIRY